MCKPIAIAVAAFAVAFSLGFAAQDIDYSAGRKMTGSVYRPHSARQYQRHARDYARVLNHYGRRDKAIPRDTAEEQVAEMRHNLDAAKKEVAKLAKDEQLKDNKKIQDQVAKVQKHQAKADEQVKMLEEFCAKEGDLDSASLCDCCSTVYEELEAADAEHDKLMKMLGIEPLEEVTAKARAKRKT